ncbi:MAG TPA: hypothetical protein VGA55_00365, partial [Bacteroidota bacterium]
SERGAVSASLVTTAGKDAVWFFKSGEGKQVFETVLFPVQPDSETTPSLISGGNGSYTVRFADREDRITRKPEGVTIRRFRGGKLISSAEVGQ